MAMTGWHWQGGIGRVALAGWHWQGGIGIGRVEEKECDHQQLTIHLTGSCGANDLCLRSSKCHSFFA